jgi:uncharacterized repeat protein (TIGR03837 family)
MVWDIFCKVIDNYGDASSAWRLARQLTIEHNIKVRLWLDELETLSRLCKALDPDCPVQTLNGIDIRKYSSLEDSTWDIEPIHTVIEMFGCGLPHLYQKHLNPPFPKWIHLDYLSAEAWIESCHGLSSPQGINQKKHFLFPGFTEKSAGLLREKNLLQDRDGYRSQKQCRDDLFSTLRWVDQPNTLSISLFSYPHAPIENLLQSCARSRQASVIFLPEAQRYSAIEKFFAAPISPYQTLRKGHLSVHPLPFLPPDDYDRLLWSCDLNFVRGEDSFVRAQWAARPFIWHIYPQNDDSHQVKLHAFYQRYQQNLPASCASALNAMTKAWNNSAPVQEHWEFFLSHQAPLLFHAQHWSNFLSLQDDLATRLIKFCRPSSTIAAL